MTIAILFSDPFGKQKSFVSNETFQVDTADEDTVTKWETDVVRATITKLLDESATPGVFVAALAENGLHVARVAENETSFKNHNVIGKHHHREVERVFDNGEYVVVANNGDVYRLDFETVTRGWPQTQDFLSTLDPTASQSIEATKQRFRGEPIVSLQPALEIHWGVPSSDRKVKVSNISFDEYSEALTKGMQKGVVDLRPAQAARVSLKESARNSL